ncbi:MAG: pilus assembly protein TadG-related protein [Kiritimatiellia bacterium]
MITTGNKKQNGQALIFLLMVMVILVFAVLWNVDIHKIIALKSRSQHAGDAAALMAARWQGITLNIIGDLNIMQAVAISEEDAYALAAITNIQKRLCFTGPLIALEASQQAAKNNGIYANPAFSSRLRAHAQRVREEYPHRTDDSGNMLFPEPYPGAWQEYAAMLDSVANNGVAAGPDNAHFYSDIAGAHTLLDQSFYDAVASSYWCWFFFHDYSLLENYVNYQSWPPLPPIENRQYENAEIFGLWLNSQRTQLATMTTGPDAFRNLINTLAADRNLGEVTTNTMAANAAWFVYDPGRWGAWETMNTAGADRFPLTGSLKDQYNYLGADAVCRIMAEGSTMLTPDQTAPEVIWTAAAKPFGSLNNGERPNRYHLVLPAFHEVALIPVDSATGSGGGAYDIAWRDHIETHLEPYLARGTDALERNCYYCQQLTRIKWESPQFRQRGIQWLSVNSHLCVLPPSGPGPGRGGGTRRGH